MFIIQIKGIGPYCWIRRIPDKHGYTATDQKSKATQFTKEEAELFASHLPLYMHPEILPVEE